MRKQILKTEGFTPRLIALLETSSVTQSALAGHLGVSQGTVSAWVNGAIPHRRTARALADAFGVMPDWLLYGTGEKLPPGRSERVIRGFAKPAEFSPPLSERSAWPKPVGLDQPALKELGVKLGEAADALSACAKIFAKSAGHKRGRKRKRAK